MAKKGLEDIFNIMLIMFLIFGISFLLDIDNPGFVDPIDTEPVNTELVDKNSLEMQKLIDFLHTDTTNLRSYDDLNRGVNYYVCTGYTRDLAKNANEAGIPMGGITTRKTMGVGSCMGYYHAMNYVIIDDRFLIIEPQGDEIYTLQNFRHRHIHGYDNRYITVFPDAQMISNYGRCRATVDINLIDGYNETDIIRKFSLH